MIELGSRCHEAVIGYRFVASYGHRGWSFELREEHYSRDLVDKGDVYLYMGRGYGREFPKRVSLLRPGITEFQVVLGVPVSARKQSVQSRKALIGEMLDVIAREGRGQQTEQWQRFRELTKLDHAGLCIPVQEMWGCVEGSMNAGNSVKRREVLCF